MAAFKTTHSSHEDIEEKIFFLKERKINKWHYDKLWEIK